MTKGSLFDSPLDFTWVDAALEAWADIEEMRARQTTVREMARELVAICRSNRERVENAERYLDRYREVIPNVQKQEIFRLVAELLLFIQYRGVRIRCVDDPIKILKASGGENERD